MKIELKFIDSVIIFFGILWFSRYFNFILEDLSDGRGVKGSSILFQLVSLSIYAYSVFRLLKKKDFIIHQFCYNPFPLLLVIWCALSVLWSIDFGLTLRRVIALFGMFGFALFIASYISEKDKVEFLSYPLIFGMLSSYFLVLFIPSLGVSNDFGVESHIGLWQGVYGFKNTLALIVSFLIIFMINGKYNKYAMLFLALAGLMLFKTQSTSALLSTFCALSMLFTLLLVEKRQYGLVVFILGIMLTVGSLLLLNIEYVIYDVIQKDMTASGRTDIWSQILEAVQGKFLGLGYGGVFWGLDSLAYYFMDDIYIYIGHSHNGYIDARLELGIPGVILYMLVMLYPMYKSMIFFRKKPRYAILTITYFTFLIIYSLSGSGFLRVNSVILLFTLLMSLNMTFYKDKACWEQKR